MAVVHGYSMENVLAAIEEVVGAEVYLDRKLWPGQFDPLYVALTTDTGCRVADIYAAPEGYRFELVD